MESEYDMGFEEWCNNNTIDIEEQYFLWMEDEIDEDDFYQKYYLHHFKYHDIPYDFKMKLYLAYLDEMENP